MEPTDNEMALISLLNSIELGWGDHVRTPGAERSGVIPLNGDSTAGIEEHVLEVTTEADAEFDANDEVVNPEGVLWIQVGLELRRRGEGEGSFVSLNLPCDSAQRLAPEEDEALGGLISKALECGLPARYLS